MRNHRTCPSVRRPRKRICRELCSRKRHRGRCALIRPTTAHHTSLELATRRGNTRAVKARELRHAENLSNHVTREFRKEVLTLRRKRLVVTRVQKHRDRVHRALKQKPTHASFFFIPTSRVRSAWRRTWPTTSGTARTSPRERPRPVGRRPGAACRIADTRGPPRRTWSCGTAGT